jgi:hypothetical protein
MLAANASKGSINGYQTHFGRVDRSSSLGDGGPLIQKQVEPVEKIEAPSAPTAKGIRI